jgi:hypothetical protein
MNAMVPLPVEGGQALLQRSFAEAILFNDAPIPATIRAASGPASASRFGVYRNNVIASLINAITARYPVVRKLLWPESFDLVARLYVTAEPPRSPMLLNYGDGFPHFLRRVGQGVAAEYVADIAELEAARTRAYHAADATPISWSSFAHLSTDEFPNMRLKLHPSVSLLKSRFPIVSVWETNLYANDNAITQWKQESALVARPHLDVDVQRLPPGAYEFLTKISEGQTIGAAVTHAIANAPALELRECFNFLLAAEIVTGIERSKP